MRGANYGRRSYPIRPVTPNLFLTFAASHVSLFSDQIGTQGILRSARWKMRILVVAHHSFPLVAGRYVAVLERDKLRFR